jgi:hypothetical protein
VVCARGANGEGETDAEVDATGAGGGSCGSSRGGGGCIGGAGIIVGCRCDVAVTDGDLDFLAHGRCEGVKKKKIATE